LKYAGSALPTSHILTGKKSTQGKRLFVQDLLIYILTITVYTTQGLTMWMFKQHAITFEQYAITY